MKNANWFSLLLVLTAPLLSVIDVFIINVAIPAIRKGIHASEAQLQLVIALYLLAYACLLVTGGRSGDYLGRKKVFLAGMLGFSLASALCGLAHSPLFLNAARFLQGIAAAFMVPQTIAFIQVLFPNATERTKAIGWYGITLGLASMLGQFLGGLLTSFHFWIDGWRLIFFINVPIGLAAVGLGLRYLPETRPEANQSFDLTGVILLTGALVCFIVPLIQGRELGWPAWCMVLLALSVGSFVTFYRHQQLKKRRKKQPLIDMDLFLIPDFTRGIGAVICCFIMHSAFLLMSALLFQNGYGLSPLVSGGCFVLWGGCMLLCSLWSMKLVSRNGKQTVLAGVILMAVSTVLQLVFFTGSAPSLLVIGLVLLIHGAGAGFTYSTLLNVTLRSVPTPFAGASAGIYSTAQQAAGAFGIASIGGLFFSVLAKSNYQTAFLYGSGANLLILVVMALLVTTLPVSKVASVTVGD
ncbi:MFS transporter [Spirosoma sp. KNUC1025]|uniref:MFS transporter n=1 Tax=Spirosoma sp. KNUC1025 TaxID=2894082 RepID=UPI001E405886|nr:MFS transporter [Spirosoma sp. KNUC1025]UFH57802.1 MFS transporter [Spirosoma sp. KNUC1025]